MNLNSHFLQNSTGIKLADWDQSIVIRLLLQHTWFYTGSYFQLTIWTKPFCHRVASTKHPKFTLLGIYSKMFFSLLQSVVVTFFFPSDSYYSGSLWCCQSYLQSSVIYHRRTEEPLAGALAHALLSCHSSSRESSSFLADPLLSHKSL